MIWLPKLSRPGIEASRKFRASLFKERIRVESGTSEFRQGMSLVCYRRAG